MFNGFNLSTIQDVKFGTTQVQQIYYGNTLIWPQGPTPPTPSPYTSQYLTIEIIDNNVDVIIYNDLTTGQQNIFTLYYSSDNGTTWSNITIDTTLSPGPGIEYNIGTYNINDKILFKATTSTITGLKFETRKNNNVARCKIYGNIMSLLYGDNFLNQTTLQGTYCLFGSGTGIKGLFSLTGVTDASNLILPATHVTEGSYMYMFHGCTNLTSAPTLPATQVDDFAYEFMFYGCTSLTTAPTLPATTLGKYSYGSMFYGCTSLTTAPTILPATTLQTGTYAYMFYNCNLLITAPELPATILTWRCYEAIFSGCQALNYVKCYATDISVTDCLKYWLDNVAVYGTFYKDANTTYPSGTSGIPSGWTVVNI